MKKIITILTAVLLRGSVFAQAPPPVQVPQKMSYQAVIRNASNALVTSTPVGMRISVLQGSSTGTAVYVETQKPTTNINGLVSLQIGTGTIVTGSFGGINWANGPYFIKTETDPTGGTTYTIAGTNELLSVPYALFSANGTPGPQGPPGAGGITQAGPEILVTGSGTAIAPYVITTRVYTIGLWPELGGYVFWLSTDGRHGLVAETQDQTEEKSWYDAQNDMSEPSSHSANGSKFRDWRMPTKYELNEMYLKRVAIGGFSDQYYWSAIENLGSDYAWLQRFLDGDQLSQNKVSNIFKARAVRSF